MTIFQSSLGGCFATHPLNGTVFGKARWLYNGYSSLRRRLSLFPVLPTGQVWTSIAGNSFRLACLFETLDLLSNPHAMIGKMDLNSKKTLEQRKGFYQGRWSHSVYQSLLIAFFSFSSFPFHSISASWKKGCPDVTCHPWWRSSNSYGYSMRLAPSLPSDISLPLQWSFFPDLLEKKHFLSFARRGNTSNWNPICLSYIGSSYFTGSLSFLIFFLFFLAS